MADPHRDMGEALDLIRRATAILTALDGRDDARPGPAPPADGIAPALGVPHTATHIPLSLMRMALALIDRDGQGTSAAACHLQSAIDQIDGARPNH